MLPVTRWQTSRISMLNAEIKKKGAASSIKRLAATGKLTGFFDFWQVKSFAQGAHKGFIVADGFTGAVG